MYEKCYTVHVVLQRVVAVKSAAAALTDVPNESIWLLLAGALWPRGVQVSQMANTIPRDTHKFLERSLSLHELQEVVPWPRMADAESTAGCALLLTA